MENEIVSGHFTVGGKRYAVVPRFREAGIRQLPFDMSSGAVATFDLVMPGGGFGYGYTISLMIVPIPDEKEGDNDNK